MKTDKYISVNAFKEAYKKEHKGEPGRAFYLVDEIPAADVISAKQYRELYGKYIHLKGSMELIGKIKQTEAGNKMEEK